MPDLPSSFLPPPSFIYSGKTALVTGASKGIGACLARELAVRGANLILTARSRDLLEALAAEIRGRHPVTVHALPADLSRPEAPQRLFDEVGRAGLSVDLLVNNAGFGRLGSFVESDPARAAEMMELNIRALAAMTRLFLPPMLERGRGGILNIASTAAFQPLPKLALYAASKAFVLSFTEALWAEVKDRGIRVLCLCPGNTESEFHETAGMPPRYVFLRAGTEALVRHGLHVFSKSNRPTTIHGLLNRLLAWSIRFAPRALALRVTSLLYR